MFPDSTFLHDLVRDEDAAVDTLSALIDAGTPVAISALTVFEVGVGLHGAGEQFDEIVDELEVVPLGSVKARHALTIQRALYDARKAIGAIDALIAGTACERADPRILMRNVDEFERVESIDVVSY